MAHDEHVVIAGAGLAGALLAVDLARMGYRVDLYERRPDPRQAGYIGGRSINLALSVRGLTALAEVGLDAPVLEDAIRMPGRMLHDAQGDLTFQAYSHDPADAINSVSRGGLNITLLDAADAEPNVAIHFDERCVDADLDETIAVFKNNATGEVTQVKADCIVGADGAFSAIRAPMMRTDRFDYSQTYLRHGYKELVIPPAIEIEGADPTKHDGFAIEPNALHIWPRGGSMMIALPNADKSFTCTLFWPFEGDHAFESIDPNDAASVRAFFTLHYPDAVPVMPTLTDDYSRNPVSSLVTVRCDPWHRNRTVLVGDAAHAIVPFFGQGMNAAFEDVRVLCSLLREDGGFDRVLPAYSEARKANADAIADMALDNFIEMRDTVADEEFLYRKRVEQALHGSMPERAQPLYNLVSFSNIPYDEAREKGRALGRIVARVAERLPRQEAALLTDDAWNERVVSIGRELLGA